MKQGFRQEFATSVHKDSNWCGTPAQRPFQCPGKGKLMTVHSPQIWKDLATQFRADSIRSTTAAGSGHPTSSMSGAELMSVLLAEYLHYDFDDPHNLRNDRLIFSKGHAAPLLYALYKA